MITWLLFEAVLAMHKAQIVQHGGDDGVRDIGLLDSALARPKNVEAYEPDADLARLAAAYGYGIAKNHPFIDGNKRTALVATLSFLEINGVELIAKTKDLYLAFLSLADGTLTEDELAAWLRERIVS